MIKGGAGVFVDMMRLNNGIGLSNTRARLEQLYGASHRFELVNANAPSQGAICRIELPARVHGGAPT